MISNAMKDWLRDEEHERKQALKATWCCDACGEKWGERTRSVTTYHNGTCDVCGMEAGVCNVRTWGWLKRARKEEGVGW